MNEQDQIEALLSKPADIRGLEQASKEFLEVEDNRKVFAECICRGGSRSDFIGIEGLAEPIYDNLRTVLNQHRLNDGSRKVVAIRGRRGGLSIVDVGSQTSIPDQTEKEKALEVEFGKTNSTQGELEKSYYEPVKAWAIEAGYKNCQIVGGRLPGYKWENPDLLSVDADVSKLSRQIRFYVASFEVKLRVEPYAVWQAAHYQRFSNEVYLAFAQSEKEIRSRDLGRIFEVAVELGLGILCWDGQKFKELQSPRVFSPDESRTEEIITNFEGLFKDSISEARQVHNDCFKIGFVD